MTNKSLRLKPVLPSKLLHNNKLFQSLHKLNHKSILILLPAHKSNKLFTKKTNHPQRLSM
jgi:hypothetical protein